MIKQLITVFIFIQGFLLSAQQILNEKERAIVIDEILDDRFNNLLPKLMDAADLDMWVVISREYN
ncbi:MAG: Xaa-Pro aminopeptidase, partial [Maribacter dokdonensis]